MTAERQRRRSRDTDVDKTVVLRRNFKGGRSNELVITGRPRTQGEVDLEGLLSDIERQNQRIQQGRSLPIGKRRTDGG